jgi:hypothetical protein
MVTAMHVLARRTRFQVIQTGQYRPKVFHIIDTAATRPIGRFMGMRLNAPDAVYLALKLEAGHG